MAVVIGTAPNAARLQRIADAREGGDAAARLSRVQLGQLELRDPRAAASYGRLPGFMFGRAMTITPKPGLMVVFPA
ncbi:hypothetical protein [Rhodospirillaceae bacterium SYSU D60014]|uniref:hypothetical protein n=1 Tax=Virgifigura deserti TaxID=2268457 RepID=UPI000E65F8A5